MTMTPPTASASAASISVVSAKEGLFIPTDTVQSTVPSERIALIGPPGSGKTTSLRTFPNLILFDVDKKAPLGIPTIPAWSPDWADNVLKNTAKNGRIVPDVPNFRDAIKKWIRENHARFSSEQTFAIDSWSFLQDACDNQTFIEDTVCGMARTKDGKHNDFWFWEQKLDFTREIVKYIRTMRCRVVVTFHEARDRNEKGELNGKIRPMMDGKYKDYILGAFTNVWRMLPNMPSVGPTGLIKRNPDGTVIADTGYFWQLAGDSVVDLNCDDNISALVRKENITKIQIIKNPDNTFSGGYKAIQELYAKHGLTRAA